MVLKNYNLSTRQPGSGKNRFPSEFPQTRFERGY
jgi:hypothetical protein